MKNKNFLVIGNPIGHSLSPTLHNFWFKKHKLKNCLYKKQKLNAFDLAKFVKNIIDHIRIVDNLMRLNVIPNKQYCCLWC